MDSQFLFPRDSALVIFCKTLKGNDMKHLLFGLSLTGILLCPADVSALDWERAFLKTECPEKIEFKPGEKMEFKPIFPGISGNLFSF